jgi:hypothetical protein
MRFARIDALALALRRPTQQHHGASAVREDILDVEPERPGCVFDERPKEVEDLVAAPVFASEQMMAEYVPHRILGDRVADGGQVARREGGVDIP